MKVVISPAKSLDFTTDLPISNFTKPAFLKQSKEVNTVLKTLTPNELKKTMSISDKLAELNWQRNKVRKYKLTEVSTTVRQAVFAFNGDVYTGLDAYSLSSEKV
ncbi:MAG TPA: peroxide stress protein YaaA, partial [Flavobacterium sp.]|nr:peroxide stress protein YaaA [Flavobacterium sp.]